MEKLWVITWSRAIGGDEIPTDAFGGCSGVFRNFEAARVCFEAEKDYMVGSLRKDFSEDDLAIFEDSLRVEGGSGLKEENYSYEIDYTTPDDSRVQYYISLEQIEFAG